MRRLPNSTQYSKQSTYFSVDVKEQVTKIGDFEVVWTEIGAIEDGPCELDDDKGLNFSNPISADDFCELNESVECAEASECDSFSARSLARFNLLDFLKDSFLAFLRSSSLKNVQIIYQYSKINKC